MNRFVITGLPRSRTAWFSAYLSSGDVFCYHEAIRDERPLEGYPHTGTADCGYLLCPDWVESIGEHKLVVIHRNPANVVNSLKKMGIGNKEEYEALESLATALGHLNGLHICYDEINDRLEEMHDYLCLPNYDENRADMFKPLNIQTMNWSK